MDKFYNTRRNTEHFVVDPGPDILRLARELQQRIKSCSQRQMSYKAANLITLGSEMLAFSIQKFNKKMCPSTSILDHEEPTIEENENETNALDVDVAEAIDEAHDNK